MNDCEVCKIPISSKQYICNDCRKAFIDWYNQNVDYRDDEFDTIMNAWFTGIEWYIKNIKDR